MTKQGKKFVLTKTSKETFLGKVFQIKALRSIERFGVKKETNIDIWSIFGEIIRVAMFLGVAFLAFFVSYKMGDSAFERLEENARFNAAYRTCLNNAAFRYCDKQECDIVNVHYDSFTGNQGFNARFDVRRGDSSDIQFTFQERLDCAEEAERAK